MYPHSSLLFFFSFLPSSLAQRDGERPQHTRERRPVEIESSRKEKASKDWFSPCNTTLSASPPPLVLLPTTRVGQIGLSFFIFLFFYFPYFLILIQLCCYNKNWILFKKKKNQICSGLVGVVAMGGDWLWRWVTVARLDRWLWWWLLVCWFCSWFLLQREIEIEKQRDGRKEKE